MIKIVLIMKANCRAFDDNNDSDINPRQKTNDAWAELVSVFGHNELADQTYVAGSTKELVPIHIVNDVHHGDSFIVHSGLILFHLTIHALDVNFKYPHSGSFFGTTLSHSLFIAFGEKKEAITEGQTVFSNIPNPDDPSQELYDETKIKFGWRENMTEEEKEDVHDRMFSTKFPTKARLITYQLKRNIRVKDSPGDAIDCAELKIDGVIGGYQEGNHKHTGKTVPANLNELRICSEPLEDYIEYLEEIEITPKMVSNQIFKYVLSDWMVYNNMTIINTSLPEQLFDWSYVSNGIGLMGLYAFLSTKKNVDPLFRFLLFHNVVVYVKSSNRNLNFVTSIAITIPIRNGSMIAKVWCKNSVKDVWPLLEFFIKSYDRIKEIDQTIELLSIENNSSLILENDLIERLRAERVPLEQYML